MKNQMKNAESTKVVVSAVVEPKQGLQVIKKGEEPKAEETEAKIVETVKPALNLERTMNLITDLHTKIRQRERLQHYADGLAEFKVTQQEENLVDSGYAYRGCKITLKDDEGSEYTVKHPEVVKEVAKFLEQKFSQKLTEIEAEITLP